MRKINNAYTEIDGYNCFGCSPSNKTGLTLEFFETENGVYAEWMPKNDFEGYHNHLHGGIQATLMDEIGSWILPVKVGSSGVTKTLTVNYLKPVFIDKGLIKLTAELISFEDNIARVNVKLCDSELVERSNAHIDFFVFPENIARKKYYFPGKEKF